MMMSDQPHPVDVHVGSRLRIRRTLLGISQDRLGSALGITFQQVQKYERGTNRISASKLFDFARVLEVPISYFFDEFAEPGATPGKGVAERQLTFGDDLLSNRETLELVRAYFRIDDPAVRRRLLDLIRALAADGPDGNGR